VPVPLTKGVGEGSKPGAPKTASPTCPQPGWQSPTKSAATASDGHSTGHIVLTAGADRICAEQLFALMGYTFPSFSLLCHPAVHRHDLGLCYVASSDTNLLMQNLQIGLFCKFYSLRLDLALPLSMIRLRPSR